MDLRAAAVLAVTAVLACGGDDEPGAGGGPGVSGNCSLQMTLSGALGEKLDWDERQGCGGGNSKAADRTAGIAWGGLVNPLNVQLWMTGIDQGMPAQGVPATVTIRKDRTLTWVTPAGGCRVDVAGFAFREQNIVGKSYRIWGTGRCPMPADAKDGGATGAIAISDFTFRSTTLYAD